MKTMNYTANHSKYKEITKKIRKNTRQDKNKYILETCSKIEKMNKLGRSDSMFKEMRTLTGDFKPALNIIQDKHGNKLTANKDVLEK